MNFSALNLESDRATDVSRPQLRLRRPVPPHLELAREILSAEAAAILSARAYLDEEFCAAVQLVLECEGHVVVSGVGKSGLIGQKLSATFSSTGAPSHFLHPTEALHGDLGRIRRGDLVLLLSHSGETDEVVNLATILRQDQVPLVTITKRGDSHLGRLSDAAIALGHIDEACHLNLAPTSTTTAMLATGDALAMVVSQARHFTADEFHKSHPGGMLGQKMMPIQEFLRFRVGVNLVVGREDSSVREVLAAADKVARRCGAILVVSEDGKLSGILTDADLRRLLIKHGSTLLDRQTGEVMTRHPVSATADQPVGDAIQIIRERRLDELPILNSDGFPIGVLDVQDLMALKLIDED